MASGNTLIQFGPLDAEFESASFPQFDLRNFHPVLDFDTTAEEFCYFTGTLPKIYAGGGLTVRVRWAASTATSGNCRWAGAFERLQVGTLDIDANSFASDQAANTATNGTSGVATETALTFTSGANMDSLAAGETFRFRLTRDVSDSGDTMAGDAELIAIIIEET